MDGICLAFVSTFLLSSMRIEPYRGHFSVEGMEARSLRVGRISPAEVGDHRIPSTWSLLGSA